MPKHEMWQILLSQLGPLGALVIVIIAVILFFIYRLIEDNRKEIIKLTRDNREQVNGLIKNLRDISKEQTDAIIQGAEAQIKLREEVLRRNNNGV